MIKNILVSACLLLSVFGFAQEGSYSPYSFYGIGDQRFKGTAETRAMGGLTVFPDSIHLNIQNPASISSLKLTTLTIGASSSVINMETETQSGRAKRTTLDYFAVAVPVTSKLGVAFGLLPFSSVGYKISSEGTLPSGEDTRRDLAGTGDINRVFLAAGYAITKNFKFGAEVNYNFGEIETTSLFTVPGVVQYGTLEQNGSEITGMSANFGLMYEGRLTRKLRVYGGLTYSPEAKLKSVNARTITLFSISGTGVSLEPYVVNVEDTDLILPSKFALGAGIGQPQKWMAGTEVTLSQSKDQVSRFFVPGSESNVRYENAIKYSIGGYYIPNYNSFSSYISRITYRAGARYENTGLIINDQSITDAAVSAGLGFPISNLFSNINIGFEYGKRGTKAYQLVEENYVNITIGLSFNDKWFQRRKYD